MRKVPNNRTDALQTDINLFFTITDSRNACSRSLSLIYVGSITSRCSGKEPALLPRTHERGPEMGLASLCKSFHATVFRASALKLCEIGELLGYKIAVGSEKKKRYLAFRGFY